MNQDAYRKLISGQDGGSAAMLLRFFLGAAALVYSTVIRLRNFLYSNGWLKVHTAGVPVISVGNITVGGTGKTPLVIWLCKFLQQKQIRCAVLTRGYKATQNSKLKTRNYGDEPAILAESCPQARVIVNPDRAAGAAEAVDGFGVKVLIMDDGFQHRRLARDLDIVTVDATRPFGYGKMLPAGLLREPVAALKRADAIVITRCDQRPEAQLSELEKKLKSVNPDMMVARSIHAAVCAISAGDKEISVEGLKDKKVFAFCGIGNPDAFLDTTKGLGVDIVGSRLYNDHYHYTNNDIADIYEQAARFNADLILTTQKDWTKILNSKFSILNSQEIPFAYLAIELKLIGGEDKLRRLIEDTLAGKISQK